MSSASTATVLVQHLSGADTFQNNPSLTLNTFISFYKVLFEKDLRPNGRQSQDTARITMSNRNRGGHFDYTLVSSSS